MANYLFSPHSPLSPHFLHYFATEVDAVKFVRNAVIFALNFCKKCGEIFSFTAFAAITAFVTKIQRIHRFSYKNLPKNLNPGNAYKLLILKVAQRISIW